MADIRKDLSRFRFLKKLLLLKIYRNVKAPKFVKMNIIEKLKEKSEKLKERSLFREKATKEQIKHLEVSLNIELPQIMKSFYSTFNGGCFTDNSWCKKDLLNLEEHETIIWNSNYFLSIEELINTYNFDGPFTSIDFQEQEKATNKKLIPLIHTKGQENLVWDATNKTETKILDAFHEVNADEWNVLFSTFEDLLTAYIDTEGDIETIS